MAWQNAKEPHRCVVFHAALVQLSPCLMLLEGCNYTWSLWLPSNVFKLLPPLTRPTGCKCECQRQHMHPERLSLQRGAEGLARLLRRRPTAAE